MIEIKFDDEGIFEEIIKTEAVQSKKEGAVLW